MKSNKLISVLLFSLDVAVLIGLFYGFTGLRMGMLAVPDQFWLSLYVIIVITWIVLYVINGYNSTTDMISLSYTSQHVIAIGVGLLMTIIAIYSFTLIRSHHFSRSVLLLTYFTFIPLSLMYRRFITIKIIKNLKERFFVVLGITPLAKSFYQDYTRERLPRKLRFFDLSGQMAGQNVCGKDSPVIEDIPDDLENDMNGSCDGIIIADINVDKDFFDRLVNVHFKNIPVMPLWSFYEEYLQKIHIPRLNHIWLLEDGFMLVGTSVYDKVKRISDIVISAAGLFLTSPLFFLLPLLIRLEGGGPALFRQPRLGKDNIPFTIYKFRTMINGAENGNIYTQKDDERLTRLGRTLRKLRLDELPQMWNVLKGDMSMIGPRAEWVRCTEEYESKIPYYHFRHLVKPGITGWAQVNYPYGESLEDTEKKLEYDLYYIRRHSFLLDANIALKTIYIMLFGKGAM